MGRLLAPASVRYVVVVDKLAPDPDAGFESPSDPRLVELLAGQLDLEEIDVNGALRVFRNAAWMPYAAAIAEPINGPGLAAARLDPATVTQALVVDGPRHASGALAPRSIVHLAESRSPNWTLEVDGARVEPIDSGWSNQYRVLGQGEAELTYRPSMPRRLVNAGQVAAWLVLLVVAVQQPSGRRARALRRKALIDGNEPVVVTRNLVLDDGLPGPIADTTVARTRSATSTAASAVLVGLPNLAEGDAPGAGEVERDGDAKITAPQADLRPSADEGHEAYVDVDEVLAPEPEIVLPDSDEFDGPDPASYADLAPFDSEPPELLLGPARCASRNQRGSAGSRRGHRPEGGP